MDNETFEQSFGKYYIKERDDTRLIADIKEAVGLSTRFQTKAFYADAIGQTRLMNEWVSEKLLDLLESMHYPSKKIDPLLYYNPLRQLLEYVFLSANRNKLIPDELIKDSVNINQCVQYLSGRNADVVGIRYGGKKDSIVPPHIKDMMFLVLNLGNVRSHSTILSEEDLQNLQNYIDSNVCNSQYMIFSLALQVCEIILYMNECIQRHSDMEQNIKMCKTIGVVELINDNQTHCLIRSKRRGLESKFCISKSYAERKKLIGKKVVVMSYEDNTEKSTKDLYPYFATVELLE